MSALVTLDNVSVRYGRHMALQDVSGTFDAASLTAVAGPNGAGKSTLLKVIAGAIKPTQGQVTVCKTCMRRTAYLPQTSAIQRDFPINVMQAVCTGFWPDTRGFGAITAAMKERAKTALEAVGLGGFEKRQINGLSGGEFQRMLFARLIVQDARVILLDEPFTAVDAATTARLIKIMLDWHREGRTIVCVLHDLLLIRKYFPESFVLSGKCLGRGHTHELFEQKLLSFDLDMAELLGPAGSRPLSHEHDHSHGHH